MFGNRISFYECRDYFKTNVKCFDYSVTEDSPSCFVVDILNGSRKITVTISSYKRGKVAIDIVDSYGIIRIPKDDLSKFDDFKMAIINSCNKIQKEFGK